jgi:hypothetical protein
VSEKRLPPIRDVVPFSTKNRVSTFRRLEVDFEGTALEQAIAERGKAEIQDAQASPADIQESSPPAVEATSDTPASVNVLQIESLPTGGTQPPLTQVERSSPTPITALPTKKQPLPVQAKAPAQPRPEADGASFEQFKRVYSRLISDGALRILQLVHSYSVGIGRASCIMTLDEITQILGLSRRQVSRIINDLEKSGFLYVPATYNTPTRKGLEMVFYTNPLDEKPATNRRFYYRDEED